MFLTYTFEYEEGNPAEIVKNCYNLQDCNNQTFSKSSRKL